MQIKLSVPVVVLVIVTIPDVYVATPAELMSSAPNPIFTWLPFEVVIGRVNVRTLAVEAVVGLTSNAILT